MQCKSHSPTYLQLQELESMFVFNNGAVEMLLNEEHSNGARGKQSFVWITF